MAIIYVDVTEIENSKSANITLKGGNEEEKVQEIIKFYEQRNAVKLQGTIITVYNQIVEEIKKPARDPREDAPPVVFRNDVRHFEELKPDMEMTGTVRNVVDFGAFVDIGVKNDGLVHISQLSDKYVKHPLDVISVGDTVKVKILSVDYDKQKVALTMKGLKQ